MVGTFNIYQGEDVDIMNDVNGPIVWVFGYGSLCWFPGFSYKRCLNGYIRGYSRRFWQGNSVHRGTEEYPGLVATLVENKNDTTWGCAFEIVGTAALNYLKNREIKLGGYIAAETQFYPIDNTESKSSTPIRVICYIATNENSQWIGEKTLDELAERVVNAKGICGHNAEYVLRLARFMREEIPGVRDDHLYHLESLVLHKLFKKKIPLTSVMGTLIPPRKCRQIYPDANNTIVQIEFTSRVRKRQMNCVNV